MANQVLCWEFCVITPTAIVNSKYFVLFSLHIWLQPLVMFSVTAIPEVGSCHWVCALLQELPFAPLCPGTSGQKMAEARQRHCFLL